jgi:hypothetical protein
MLLYTTNSWHYQLVLYVFSKEFFMETVGLDFEAMESQYNPHTKTDNFELIYKKKPRTVNFCPYCRAVVAGIVTLPFVYIWRLFPHKPKPKRTHLQIMKRLNRNSWIARGIGGGINFVMGGKNVVYAEEPLMMLLGFVQIGIGMALITGHWWAPQVVRWIIEHTPKRRKKLKPTKEQKPKKPSELAKKIHEKHDIICPPIFFVEEHEPESLR